MNTTLKKRLSARRLPGQSAPPFGEARAPVNPTNLSLDSMREFFQGNSESQYDSFFRSLPCAAVVLDMQGRLREYNDPFRNLVRGNPENAIHSPFSIYVDRNCLSEYLRHLRECHKSRETVSASISIHGHGGPLVSVRLFSIFDRAPGVKRFRIVIVDDTDRRLAIQKAQREHQAYHELIDSLNAIVWEMDAESGCTTYLSKQAERLFGKLARDWGRERYYRWNQLHVDDRERVQNELARAVALRKDFVTEYRTFTLDRNLIWVQDSITLRMVDGQLKIRGVAVDITERKTAETKTLKAAEELERRVEQRTEELKWTISELESFSYTLSHDMRAPLRSIEGYASAVADAISSKAPADTMECLQRIRNSAQRLDALVQDVLKYSSVAKLPIELVPLNLNVLVPAIADEAPGFKKAGARIDVAKKLLPVFGHQGFLSQCVFNLLSNAAKFVAPGVAPCVHIWTEPHGDLVKLFIEDNGIGIAAQDHLRIFKVFERCHRQHKIEGSGIGLAIVQRAAGRMGGTVGVESTPGKGSKFWIELRRA